MAQPLDSLREETNTYSVEPCEEGFLIVRKPGADAAFGEFARQVVNGAGDAFAAFPRGDGHGGYESVLIIPIVP